MKKIYLFCSQGMSTSLLAGNMQKIADEHKLDAEVKAYSITDMDKIIKKLKPDCILLGPQVRFLFNETKTKYQEYHAPVGLIDAKDYGMMDGMAVLKAAVKLIKNETKQKST